MKKITGLFVAVLSTGILAFQIFNSLPKTREIGQGPVPDISFEKEIYWEKAREEIYVFIMNSGSRIKPDTADLIAAAIVENAQYSDLNPYVIAAVIFAESRFRHDAVGSSGDAGLMQIIPSTAKLISEAVSQTPYNIKDIETNVKFGCWYLSAMKTRYGGNYVQILGMYNQGGDWRGAGERYAQNVIRQAEEQGLPLGLLILYDEMNVQKNADDLLELNKKS
ncbi:transglycosylase SLT domain-containing protein [candidate division WOR-3 bacterium]|nr:transglycosylase SLT domain-containing protein [candidate division WOR-3 bacterium]